MPFSVASVGYFAFRLDMWLGYFLNTYGTERYIASPPFQIIFKECFLIFFAVTNWTYNTIFAFLLFPSFIIISPLQNVIYELMNSEQSYMDDLSATLEVSAWWTQSWLAEEFIKLIHKKGRYCTFSHPLIVRSSD